MRGTGDFTSILYLPALRPLTGTMLDTKASAHSSEWTLPLLLLRDSRVHILSSEKPETRNPIRAQVLGGEN